MVGRFRWGLSAVAITLVSCALAACSGGSDERTAATLGTAITTTTTDPYAVPAVIDEAYVNRVLAGLDAAVGDVVRLVVREKALTPEAMNRLKAIHPDGDVLDLELQSFRNEIESGLADYKNAPGNAKTTVKQMISASSDCIFVRVDRDYSAVGSHPLSKRPEWVGLRPVDVSRIVDGFNPTPWAIVAEGFRPDGTQLENPCAE